ncbi:MAG: N,N-dimethylformamidase beta subunit family domain-containing protein, partial [Planctomycetota bacterium]
MSEDTRSGAPGQRRRGSTTGGVWPNAVLENFYERASGDPDQLEIWCYTDRLSYAPGEVVRFHVNTTAARYDIEIFRNGAARESVYREEGRPGQSYPTPEDCSVAGCGWPVAFELTVPADWRSGGYVVETTARGDSGASFTQHHVFLVRAAGPQAAAPILLVAATGTWTAYNDWGG